MGMAASQARYLGLTARKTNVEYEGQQVNQQRTALANQSANLFTQLMSLNVPTPPSSSDYTTLQYSYNDGYNNETITGYQQIDDPNYNYLVTHYHDTKVYTGVERQVYNPQVQIKDGKYWVGNSELTAYDSSVATDKAAIDQIKKDLPTSSFSTSDDSTKYVFKSGGVTYYSCKADLDACIASSGTIEGQMKLKEYNAANLATKAETTEKALLETDSSGRFTSVKFEDTSAVYTLNTETVTDDAAYQDAMNQYNYNQAMYQKEVEDINAKTEIIQQEDRTLELRLKQLDTEQEALQTEMDAVKKVIDKNIETTFKTFAS